MKKPELYQKTVDILLDAYNKRHLFHGVCSACAVGNIINANTPPAERISDLLLTPYTSYDGETCTLNIPTPYILPKWQNIFRTIRSFDDDVESEHIVRNPTSIRIKHPELFERNYKPAIEQCERTGYSIDELIRIEHAFETCPTGNSEQEFQFNGLVAVLDVLRDIHEVDEDSHTENSEKLKTIYSSMKDQCYV